MDVDVAERHFLHEVQAHHHHAGDPEEDDVEAGDEGARRIVAPELRRLVGPAERRERPQGRREPGVEHVLVAHEVTCGALRILGEGGRLVLAQRALHDGVGERLGERLLLRLGDEDGAVRPVPGGDLMTPPELARDAPRLDVLEPLEIRLLPGLGHEARLPGAHRVERALGERPHVHVPLVGEIRLDDGARAVAVRHGMRVRLDAIEKAALVEHGDDALARLEPILPVEGEDGVEIGRGLDVALEIRIALEIELAFRPEHVDERQAVPAADLEIVEVVRRRDLDGAGALVGVGIGVGDDRDAAPDQRQDGGAADEVAVALVIGMHRDGGVAEHGLRPGRRNRDGEVGLAFDRVADVPKVALHLDLLHLEVGDGGEELRVPVHKALVLVDEPVAIELDEHLQDGPRKALVHGEALARPVAGGAEPGELAPDGALRVRFPRPHALEELRAAEAAAVRLLALARAGARPPSGWRCRRDRCPAARARRGRACARSGTGCPAGCC